MPIELLPLFYALRINQPCAKGILELNGTGYSMFPILHNGQKVRVKKACAHELRPGQIAAFCLSKTAAAHRVIKIEEKYIYTRSNIHRKMDPPVPVDHVIGVVTHATIFNKMIPIEYLDWRALRLVGLAYGYLTRRLHRLRRMIAI